MNKKVVSKGLCMLLLCALTLCEGIFDSTTANACKRQNTNEKECSETTIDDIALIKLGGWNVNNDYSNIRMSKELKKPLDEALQGYVGISVKPLVLIGTQVVNGMNYKYLCQTAPVVPNAKKSLSLVTVHKPLVTNEEQSARITNVEEFKIENYLEDRDIIGRAPIMGGYAPCEDNAKVKLPKQVNKAFKSATGKLRGVKYTPILYLGNQIVSGSNYSVLCMGKTSTRNPETHIFVLTIYAPLKGEAVVKSIYGMY